MLRIFLTSLIISIAGLPSCKSGNSRSDIKDVEPIKPASEIALNGHICKKKPCSDMAEALDKIDHLNNIRFGDQIRETKELRAALFGIFKLLEFDLWDLGNAEAQLALQTQITICYELNSEPVESFDTKMLEDISYARAILEEILWINNFRTFSCQSAFDNHNGYVQGAFGLHNDMPLSKKEFINNRKLSVKKIGKGWTEQWRQLFMLHPPPK